MPRQLSEANARHLVVLGTPLIIIIGGLLAFQVGGYRLALLILGVVTAALVILAWLFRPRWWGNTRVQAISVTILGGLAMMLFSDELWLPYLNAFYERLQLAFPEYLPVIDLPEALPPRERIQVVITLGLIFIVLNYVWSRQHTLPPPSASSEEKTPFVEKDYEQLRDEYCDYMLRQLDLYDTDLNWSDTDYTNLEAEVEVDRHGRRNPRVEKDLVRAIRRDRTTRAFLLLGDPGSGKSVSLRRLCRQLYGEVSETGVVPVYVNLREWDGSATPTDHELSDFIRSHLKRSSGRAGKRFLDRWYEPMLADGRFFFLLDSFDEMPPVLDCDDASPRIKEVSRTFDRFFHDIHQCRGVLASRRFRQPRGFQGRRLSIRPLKEAQIRYAMSRWLAGQPLDPKVVVRRLFSERPELVSVVRNPFLADLTSQYLICHAGELPPNQFSIYDSYIRQRMREDQAELRELGLGQEQLLDTATSIARAMYDDSSIGLEADVRQIVDWVPERDVEKLVEALRLIRLIRLGGEQARRFSFVHRRFAEFFVVRSLLESDQEVPLEAIPEDSRWRDCLVVYCGVAPRDKIQPIADFCWQVIQEEGGALDDGDVSKARSVIHCLRFLRDAFMARPGPLSSFRSHLEERVLLWVGGSNILIAKLATECLGLLSSVGCSEGVRLAFKGSSIWVKETAILSSRHFESLDSVSLRAIRSYVRTLPVSRLLAGYRSLSFSFSLSENMKGQLWALRIDILSLLTLWVLFLFVFVPIVFLTRDFGVDRISLVLTLVFFELLVPYFFVWEYYFRRGLDSSLRLFLFMIVCYLYDFYESGLDSVFFLVILFLLPWESVLSLFYSAKRWGFVKCGVFLVGVVFLIFINAFVFLFLDLLGDLLGEVFLIGVSALIAGFALLNYSLVFIRFFVNVATDRRFLRRLVMPDFVSYNWIFHISSGLRTRRARIKLLETIRLGGVKLAGEPMPIPTEEWADARFREGMARLESMWLGLDE